MVGVAHQNFDAALLKLTWSSSTAFGSLHFRDSITCYRYVHKMYKSMVILLFFSNTCDKFGKPTSTLTQFTKRKEFIKSCTVNKIFQLQICIIFALKAEEQFPMAPGNLKQPWQEWYHNEKATPAGEDAIMPERGAAVPSANLTAPAMANLEPIINAAPNANAPMTCTLSRVVDLSK